MNEAAATPRLRTAAAFCTRKADHLRQRDLTAEIAAMQAELTKACIIRDQLGRRVRR
ncbi:hypothetical protein [Streptomyces sp. NPDC002845]